MGYEASILKNKVDEVEIEKMILEKVSKKGYERIILSRDGFIVTEDYFYNEEHKSRATKRSSEHKGIGHRGQVNVIWPLFHYPLATLDAYLHK